MKTLTILLLAAALCGCATTPPLKDGKPPAGWELTPKPPVPF